MAVSAPSHLPVALTRKLQQLRLRSATSARDEVRTLKLQRAQLAPSVATLFRASEDKALRFTRGVIANTRDDTAAEQDSAPLLDWARRSGTRQRRMMVRAFSQQRKAILVVHHMGGMARADARAFMKDYFAAGGRLDDVAEWLQRAGHVLRTERPGRPGTDGLFSKAWNWVKGAVKTVGDALKAAGKSLKDAVGKVLKWTASKITDFVEGLLEAGRKVGEILAEALAKGRDALNKFIRAVLAAGRRISEVLAWAVTQGTRALQDAVNAILRAGRRVAQIVTEAARKGATVLRGTVRALLKLGRRVREVIQAAGRWSVRALEHLFRGIRLAGKKVAEVAREIARFAASTVRRMVQGLYRAYRKVRDILVAFMRDQLSTVRMVLEGLLTAGVRLGQAIVGIVRGVAVQFRKGFFKGLIALGKSPFLIMKEALKTAGGVAALALATLLDVLGGHRALTAEEKKQARRVFGVSINLSRVKVAVASIPADLINLVNGARPFTTMYVLNFASWADVDMKTLIHELAHTWQGVVAGPVYMIEALHAQLLGEGYTVTDQMLRDRGNKLSRFNREQQAVIAEEYWYEQWGRAEYPRLRGQGLDVNLLRPYARQMFKARQATVVPLRPVPPIRLPVAARVARVREP